MLYKISIDFIRFFKKLSKNWVQNDLENRVQNGSRTPSRRGPKRAQNGGVRGRVRGGETPHFFFPFYRIQPKPGTDLNEFFQNVTLHKWLLTG